MSLGGFYTALARMVGDPELVRRVRRDGLAGSGFDLLALTDGDLERLEQMAHDPRMSVMCSLYRSNRLTALVRTVPAVVEALGDRLSDEVTEFWRITPRTDMQFISEAEEFCDFVRARHGDDPAIAAAIAESEAGLVGLVG